MKIRSSVLFILILVVLFFLSALSIYVLVQTPRLVVSFQNIYTTVHDNFILFTVLFCVWQLTIQLTAIPLGTVSFVFGCFLLGSKVSIVMTVLGIVLAIWPIYWIVDRLPPVTDSGPLWRLSHRLKRNLPTLSTELRRSGLLTSIALRLAPVFPGGIATASAALLGIPIRTYLIGTLLTAWIKPVVLAVSVVGMETIAEAMYHPRPGLWIAYLLILSGLTIAAVSGLAIRIWTRRTLD